MRRSRSWICFVLCFVPMACAKADSYTFQAINVPAAYSGAWAVAINNSDELVGNYGPGGNSHAFLDIAGKFSNVDYPYETFNQGIGNAPTYDWRAVAISNSGVIAGNMFDASNDFLSYLDSDGTFSLKGVAILYAYGPMLSGINDSGTAVGNVGLFFGQFPDGFVVDSKGNVTVGPVSFSNLSSNPQIYYSGINDKGDIVGSLSSTTASSVGFLYSGGKVTYLSGPALSVNNSDEVVGSNYIYENGVYTTLTYPGAQSTSLLSVNDLGQILGDYTDSSGTFQFIATPATATPEPESLALVGAGMLAFFLLRRFFPL